jgi:hypothetical protein
MVRTYCGWPDWWTTTLTVSKPMSTIASAADSGSAPFTCVARTSAKGTMSDADRAQARPVHGVD